MTYLARYAHQTRSEIRAMPVDTFEVWVRSVGQIVVRENTPER